MECFVCKTCGVQYELSEGPPSVCVICQDERQYIGYRGQEWTTLKEMQGAGYTNEFREHEPGLTGIGTHPSFAIGQRALLVQTPGGNVLWDCVSYIDDESIQRVRELGGIAALAASHPHFYGVLVEWSHAFGNAPIYIPEADEQWMVRPDNAVVHWEGKVELVPGVTLIQCGGHFEGSAVIHWAAGAEGRGALLTGDTIQVVSDRRYVSFMRSYPNSIPMNASTVRRIVAAAEPYSYDRIYGGWWNSVINKDAKRSVERSAERYIRQIQG